MRKGCTLFMNTDGFYSIIGTNLCAIDIVSPIQMNKMPIYY